MRIAVAGGTGVIGRRVCGVLGERGHEALVLTRSTGIDLVSGVGLVGRLRGVDAVIDVTSVQTSARNVSVRFFETVTANLLRAEREAHVEHHVALSIVGSDAAPFGYYAGKAAQEHMVQRGDVPWTLLRATQCHEFATQIYDQFRAGPVAVVPKMRAQPVAAREVAERLVDHATGRPSGRVRDLGGPHEMMMAEMIKLWVKATRRSALVIELPLPGALGKAMRDGTLVSGRGAERGQETFDQWLQAIEGEQAPRRTNGGFR